MRIEQWSPQHSRWREAEEMMALTGQQRYLSVHFEWHLAHVWLIALVDGAVAGLLHYALQHIGDDNECQRVRRAGIELVEAKVMAFVVVPAVRRQGIGRALQRAAIDCAREQGCFQLRSYSGGDKIANHQLKLNMGFSVHPADRNQDKAGAYFAMPLERPL